MTMSILVFSVSSGTANPFSFNRSGMSPVGNAVLIDQNAQANRRNRAASTHSAELETPSD